MILKDPSGPVRDDALLAYFKRGIEISPGLTFRLIDVLWELNSVVVCYLDQKRTQKGRVHGDRSTGKSDKGRRERQRMSYTSDEI